MTDSGFMTCTGIHFKRMYHEILFALLGLTGDIIILSEDPILRLPTFRIKDGYSLLNDAEQEQINQILPLGWYYQQFQHFQAEI